MNKVDLLWSFMKDKLDDEVLNRERKHSVIIWGVGEYGKTIGKILRSLGISIGCYLDKNNNISEWEGVIVRQPDYLRIKPTHQRVIIAFEGGYVASKEYKQYDCVYYSDYFLSLSLDNRFLEIGPYCNPFLIGEKVQYCDIKSADELREDAFSDEQCDERCVPDKIDYVLESGDLSEIKAKFDGIVSFHSAMYQPDFLKHLQTVEEMLVENGRYVLGLPDKRFSYMHYFKESNIVDVLEAYYLGRKEHTLRAYINYAMRTHNDATRHWEGDSGIISFNNQNFQVIVEDYKKNGLNPQEWYFTPDSFKRLYDALLDLGLIKLKIDEFYYTEINTLTFFVVFRKEKD